MFSSTTSLTSTIWRKGKTTFLRPLELADAPTIYQGINNPEAYEYLANTDPKGLGFEEEWIKSKQKPSDTDITVAVCLLETSELIGTMGLHKIDPINRTASTGAVIFFADHQGKGYGTDAKMTLLDYAFNFRNLELIESRVIGFNGRSARYSAKCGYVEEARLRRRHFRRGAWHDEIILSVTREEWLPLWEKYQQT
jgi:RimJ/RimL family protein N-acetyltransferase